MATYSSNLAWRIPWTEEPRRLQSMGSQRVGHNGAASSFSVNLQFQCCLSSTLCGQFSELWQLLSCLECVVMYF